MDRTDYQILNILQADCRATLKCIGDQVGLTAPAVSERVRRMEEKGVIRDFRIDIDRARLGSGMTGFILVALEPEKYNASANSAGTIPVSSATIMSSACSMPCCASPFGAPGSWTSCCPPSSGTATPRPRWS